MKKQCIKCKKEFFPDRFGRIPHHICETDEDPIISNGREISSIVYDDFTPSNYDSNTDSSSSTDTSSSDIGGGGDYGGAGSSNDW